MTGDAAQSIEVFTDGTEKWRAPLDGEYVGYAVSEDGSAAAFRYSSNEGAVRNLVPEPERDCRYVEVIAWSAEGADMGTTFFDRGELDPHLMTRPTVRKMIVDGTRRRVLLQLDNDVVGIHDWDADQEWRSVSPWHTSPFGMSATRLIGLEVTTGLSAYAMLWLLNSQSDEPRSQGDLGMGVELVDPEFRMVAFVSIPRAFCASSCGNDEYLSKREIVNLPGAQFPLMTVGDEGEISVRVPQNEEWWTYVTQRDPMDVSRSRLLRTEVRPDPQAPIVMARVCQRY